MTPTSPSSISHPSSTLSVPLQLTARVISSCPLSSVSHLAVNQSIVVLVKLMNNTPPLKMILPENSTVCVYRREKRLYALQRWLADLSKGKATAHSPAAKRCPVAAVLPLQSWMKKHKIATFYMIENSLFTENHSEWRSSWIKELKKATFGYNMITDCIFSFVFHNKKNSAWVQVKMQ